jgi:chromosome segregation ATPase
MIAHSTSQPSSQNPASVIDMLSNNDIARLIAEMSKVFATKADFAELKAEVAELRAEVKELRKDVAELKKDVAQLKIDVAELKKDVAQLKIDVAELKKDVFQLKKDVSQLKSEMVEVKGQLVTMKKTDDSLIAGQLRLETEMKGLSAEVHLTRTEVKHTHKLMERMYDDFEEMRSQNFQFKDDIVTELKGIREQLYMVQGHRDMLEDHQLRLEALESNQKIQLVL